MRAGLRRGDVLARAVFGTAAAVVIVLALHEARARIVLRESASLPREVDSALSSDVPLRLARARADVAAGELSRARAQLRAALNVRPRDPDVLLALAEASESVPDRLRFAAIAVRVAPHRVAPAEFAFATAFEAVGARAPRAAAAHETANRLRAAGVTEGVVDAQAEGDRLDGEMRAYLSLALSIHAETSPTARGIFFLTDALTRAKALAAELDAP